MPELSFPLEICLALKDMIRGFGGRCGASSTFSLCGLLSASVGEDTRLAAARGPDVVGDPLLAGVR